MYSENIKIMATIKLREMQNSWIRNRHQNMSLRSRVALLLQRAQEVEEQRLRLVRLVASDGV